MMIRKILAGFLLLLLIIALWQYEMVVYGLAQARGQLQILANVRPVDEVMQDPSTQDSIRQKLIFIQEVRKFAVDSLGINDSNNYTTFYDQQGKPSLWVVTAAEPFSLTAKEWKFPLLGGFPYKGFFEYTMAQEEVKKLKEQNLDTYLGVVGGWSTLGWTKDPILSNMLKRNEGDLADLIIHELTHATLFVKDSVQFNENLATFIGNKGAEKFLMGKFGERSVEYKQYEDERADNKRFTAHVLRGSDKLDSLYGTFTEADDANYKQKKKDALIQKIFEEVDTISFADKGRYTTMINRITPNNAYFMSYIRYRSNFDDLEKIYKNEFNSDLELFLEYYKEKYPSL